MLPEQLKSFLMGYVLSTPSQIGRAFGGANANPAAVVEARRALVKSWELGSCGQSGLMIERLSMAKKSTPTGVNLATAASEMLSVIRYNASVDRKIAILRDFRSKLNTEIVCGTWGGVKD
jgi:hypothetical protein